MSPAYIQQSVLKLEKMMSDCEVEEFCTTNNRNVKNYSIYVEVEGDIEFDTKLDIIFMNKVVSYNESLLSH